MAAPPSKSRRSTSVTPRLDGDVHRADPAVRPARAVDLLERGDRDDQVLVEPTAHRRALVLKDADHGELAAVYLYGPVQRIDPWEKLFRDAVSEMKKENGGTIKGLVLDLRNNPGGVLSAAVSVSDAFLTKGAIVYTEGRLDDAELRFNAKPTDILNGAPMVVLVNGGSASDVFKCRDCGELYCDKCQAGRCPRCGSTMGLEAGKVYSK